MAKKSFLLVSLKENKAKKLAEVISNNTCRKMLDHLADKKDATESDISKDLKIPISTVHYNMKALLTARLVKCDEYHYSAKGKEVNHYRLANQYVIIAPEGEKALIREKLKSIIPTALIMGFAAGVIKLFSGSFGASEMLAAPMRGAMKSSADMDTANSMAYGASEIAEEAVADGAGEAVATGVDDAVVRTVSEVVESEAQQAVPKAAEAVVTHAPPAAQQVVVERVPEVWGGGSSVISQAPEIALWFLIGAVSGVVVYLLVDYIVKRIRNR
ncbi:hypothetical protein ACFL3V_01565 [Nanoarchaeota archaeon]